MGLFIIFLTLSALGVAVVIWVLTKFKNSKLRLTLGLAALLTAVACGGGSSDTTANPSIATGQTPAATPTLPIALNAAPFASSGISQIYPIGEYAQLDGSLSSDKNNDTLTYNWTLVSSPTGSKAPTSFNSSKAQVLVDKPGEYTYALKVYDGKLTSQNESVVSFSGRQEKEASLFQRSTEVPHVYRIPTQLG
jgi:hypothetical protein